MTIDQAITRIDTLKANSYSRAQKIAWLSELDGRIYHEIILTHAAPAGGYPSYEPYSAETAGGTELLAAYPYDDVYERYLACQIDIANREIGFYQNDMALFNTAYKAYGDAYNRTHMPVQRVIQYDL